LNELLYYHLDIRLIDFDTSLLLINKALLSL